MPEAGPPAVSRTQRRDLILIPLISILTCLTMLVLAEVAARVGWPEHDEDACVVADPVLGHRFRPDCASRTKSFESPWVDNRYNACGYRTDQGCGPRPEGVRRVNLTGSSFAQGLLVRYEDTIGATMADALARACRAEVQVENMAMIGYGGDVVLSQLDESLSLRPDAIVYLVSPFDFEDNGPAPAASGDAVAAPPRGSDLLRRAKDALSASQTFRLATHFLFADSRRFGALYLNYGDRADFLRPPFSEAWRRRLDRLDGVLARLGSRAREAGVPVALAYVPLRAQAIHLSSGDWPRGVDPTAFGEAIGEIAGRHGLIYVDASRLFARVPDAGRLFYPQDGHLRGEGTALVGRDLAQEIRGRVPAFAACRPSDNAGLVPRRAP